MYNEDHRVPDKTEELPELVYSSSDEEQEHGSPGPVHAGTASAMDRTDIPSTMPTDSASASLLPFTDAEQPASDLVGTAGSNQSTANATAQQAQCCNADAMFSAVALPALSVPPQGRQACSVRCSWSHR